MIFIDKYYSSNLSISGDRRSFREIFKSVDTLAHHLFMLFIHFPAILSILPLHLSLLFTFPLSPFQGRIRVQAAA